MPANLTPVYLQAEQRFKSAKTNEDKVKALEEMLATIPRHKGTEKMQADLKRRLSKLRTEQARRPASRAGITRLVDRLAADGLVSRAKCASDARGYFAVLTAGGLARLEAARPGHIAAVRRFFLDSYTAPELETLAEFLERSQPLD